VALSGDVLVTDPVASQVKVFAPDGGLIRRWGSFGAGDGQFFLGGPHAIDVAPSGEVFVTDPGNHRVQAFQPDGEFIRTWGSEGSGSGQFAGTIAGIAADSAGSVVVTESGLTEAGHQVQVFDAEGNFLRRWGGFGSGDGEFWSPTGVAVNGATGEAFVADSANWRVQALDRTGAFVRKWGSCCGHDGELGGTGGLGLDFEAVDPTDALIRKWGRCCGDDTEFGSPEGLDLDPLGRVLVADPSMARIQLFTRTGAFLSSWGSCCAAPVWEVTDLVVGPSGKIYALDSANADTGAHPRIQQFAIVPATRIDSAPGGVIRDETPMFTFSADEPASSFDCRLDPEPWSGCTSPWVAPGPLADGPHRFGVRATDSVGTPDPTPATRDFTVDTAGP
jgi:DNA-binding beta-propeller fold protein YncE